jgi:hypothetical protein
LALATEIASAHPDDVEQERVFVMLDPATDDILSVCAGPSEDDKCPVADAPPYICQGLHLVGVRGAQAERVSFTVKEMIPGRCPLSVIDDPMAATLPR